MEIFSPDICYLKDIIRLGWLNVTDKQLYIKRRKKNYVLNMDIKIK